MLHALLIALFAAAQPAPPRSCTLIYPVAPNEAAARRIAESVIAARPYPERRNYLLRVRIDEDNPGQWIAYQHLPEPRHRQLRPGEVIVSSGGGGVEMRIDRCTGAITRLHYIR